MAIAHMILQIVRMAIAQYLWILWVDGFPCSYAMSVYQD